MGQTLEEMEFSILINGADRHTAEVFTDDAVWAERLERMGYQPYKVQGVSRFYRIPTNRLVSIRKLEQPQRQVSQKAIDALKKYRDAKIASSNLIPSTDSQVEI